MTDRERRLAALEQRIARLPTGDDDETDDDRLRRFDVLLGIGKPDPVRDAGLDWEACSLRARPRHCAAGRMSEAHRRRLDAVERRIGVDGTCEWGGEKHGPSWCHVVMLMIHWGGIAAHEAICPQLIDGKHMVAPYEPVHWQFTDESRRKVRWNGIPQPSGRTNNCATCRLRPGVVLDLPEWANAEWLEVGMLSPCADGPERWALDGAREDRLVASQLYRDRAAPPRDGAPVARSWRTTAASVY